MAISSSGSPLSHEEAEAIKAAHLAIIDAAINYVGSLKIGNAN